MNTKKKNWIEVGPLDAIPPLGSRVVHTSAGHIGLFRTASNQIFALSDLCPHQGGPLSEGIVHGNQVTCPLHNWRIDLASGQAIAPDEGCVNTFESKVDNGLVYLNLPFK